MWLCVGVFHFLCPLSWHSWHDLWLWYLFSNGVHYQSTVLATLPRQVGSLVCLSWSGLGWAGLPDLPPPPPHLWVCLVWFGLSLSQYYCTNCTIKHWQYDIYYLQNIHEIKVSWWNNYKCINYLYKTKPLTFDLHVKFKSKLKYKENIILPPKSLFCPLIGCSG